MLSKILDKILSVIKWPLAVLVLFFYLDIFRFFLTTGASFISNASLLYFLGALFFLVTNGRHSSSNKFLTWEHELSHAIFAWLTFKKNIRIEVLREPNYKGHAGYCYYENGDNWLITIAPYFFPTLTLILSFVYLLVNSSLYWVLDLVLGYSIAFHLKTNFLEVCHNFRPPVEGSYTDLTMVGRLFALIMIPALNFIVFAVIFIALGA
jgi:hypothetical protein|tara:strand:+ start:454 stop:1077 length:624 start_codon:yes stop_codon:yes gene_type:complete